MRVYLGCDHAGFELKQALIEHLKATGHEPIDCGAYSYDAEDDYPAFCIAAAVKTVADPGSLGIVIGGSGNGEQIAANKVPGARCALAWSVETASLAREHNNAHVDRHRRSHAHHRRGAGHRRRLPGRRVVGSATAPTPHRHPHRVREDARTARGSRRLVPEGHTLHRLARLHQRRYGRAPVRVGSPQGRFADGAASVDGRVLRKADAWGKHLFHHYEGGHVVHVHLGLYGTFTEFALSEPAGIPDPVGQVRMRMVGAEYGTDLRGPTVCEVIAESEIDDVVAQLGPDPLRPTPTRPGRGRESPSPAGRSVRC